MKTKRPISPRVPVTIEIVLGDVPLRSREAGKLLAISPWTLKNWRCSKPPVGPAFIKLGGVVCYRFRDLVEYLDKRTVRPERPAPFYRRTRVEELGLKYPGLFQFVESQVRARVPYPRIAAEVQERWGERVSDQVLSNFYMLRVWPRILEEERSEAEKKKSPGLS